MSVAFHLYVEKIRNKRFFDRPVAYFVRIFSAFSVFYFATQTAIMPASAIVKNNISQSYNQKNKKKIEVCFEKGCKGSYCIICSR